MNTDIPNPPSDPFFLDDSPALQPVLEPVDRQLAPAESAGDEQSLPAEQTAPVSQTPGKPRRPGPGLLESIGWLIGVWIAQFVFVMFGVIALSVVFVARNGLAALGSEGPNGFAVFLQAQLPVIAGITGIASVTYGLALAWFRLGRSGFRALGWQWPTLQHTVVVCLMVLPLSYLCSALQTVVLELFPESLTGLEELLNQLSSIPFPVMLFVLAFCPGVGEELIFRGVLGRGLLARYGVFVGMLMTSILFGIVHLDPAQGMAVIPMGFAMHLVYAATRSFWAPILLHFLNNSLAGFMSRFAGQLGLQSPDDSTESISWKLLVVSALATVSLLAWLYHTRAQYRTPEGELWQPAETDCGVPQDAGNYRRETTFPPWWIVAFGLTSMAGMLFLLTGDNAA